jgi:hypothetical protein
VTRQLGESALVQYGLTVAFLALAAWFVFGPASVEIPSATNAPVAARQIDTAPLRAGRAREASVTIGSFTRRCGECHDLFPSQDETGRSPIQHAHIVLDHGLNDRCFNCHDRENRDRLALRGGETVSFAEVPELCAKCHGPTYRDWQAGMHGRTVGSWDPRAPGFERLQCSDCHDPHAPAYDPMRPLPGPATLRMGGGGREVHAEPVERIDPLRKWRDHDAPHAPAFEGDLPLDVTGHGDGEPHGGGG